MEESMKYPYIKAVFDVGFVEDKTNGPYSFTRAKRLPHI
jgi:hypothetical protein